MPARAVTPPQTQNLLGKRKASAIEPGLIPTATGEQPATAPPARTRTRVMPSRSRRVGGPGIGSVEVDELILDAQKRKLESEPLIPLETPFIILTDVRMLTGGLDGQVTPGSASSSSLLPPDTQLELNQEAFQRYFERPEVIKACREQALIETPEFKVIEEVASVGGRFRPRANSDLDRVMDTSDEAYERRHRKYEAFERRQRFREKEKLKHLHYKLKERIEQLRAMDISAFLALPASAFSDPPHIVDDGADDHMVTDEPPHPLDFLPGAHINGAAAHREGERRRAEMLANAMVLEEKYQQLLPPDRIKPQARKPTETTSSAPTSTASAGEGDGDASIRSTTPPISTTKSAASKPKVKPKTKARLVTDGLDEEKDELESEEDAPPKSSPRRPGSFAKQAVKANGKQSQKPKNLSRPSAKAASAARRKSPVPNPTPTVAGHSEIYVATSQSSQLSEDPTQKPHPQNLSQDSSLSTAQEPASSTAANGTENALRPNEPGTIRNIQPTWTILATSEDETTIETQAAPNHEDSISVALSRADSTTAPPPSTEGDAEDEGEGEGEGSIVAPSTVKRSVGRPRGGWRRRVQPCQILATANHFNSKRQARGINPFGASIPTIFQGKDVYSYELPVFVVGIPLGDDAPDKRPPLRPELEPLPPPDGDEGDEEDEPAPGPSTGGATVAETVALNDDGGKVKGVVAEIDTANRPISMAGLTSSGVARTVNEDETTQTSPVQGPERPRSHIGTVVGPSVASAPPAPITRHGRRMSVAEETAAQMLLHMGQ